MGAYSSVAPLPCPQGGWAHAPASRQQPGIQWAQVCEGLWEALSGPCTAPRVLSTCTDCTSSGGIKEGVEASRESKAEGVPGSGCGFVCFHLPSSPGPLSCPWGRSAAVLNCSRKAEASAGRAPGLISHPLLSWGQRGHVTCPGAHSLCSKAQLCTRTLKPLAGILRIPPDTYQDHMWDTRAAPLPGPPGSSSTEPPCVSSPKAVSNPLPHRAQARPGKAHARAPSPPSRPQPVPGGECGLLFTRSCLACLGGSRGKHIME